MSEPGNLYVISAPSGTGKTTLVDALVDSFANITVSISHTTRPQRPNEIHGENYYFIGQTEFDQMIEHHDFLEHAKVFGFSYGTSNRWVEQTLAQGIDVILEIDWQGCQQIQRLFGHCISIFILPPSVEHLFQRLTKRNQDNAEVIRQRIQDVHETTKHINEYDYIVINDDFNDALQDLTAIVTAGRLLKRRQVVKYAQLVTELEHKDPPMV